MGGVSERAGTSAGRNTARQLGRLIGWLTLPVAVSAGFSAEIIGCDLGGLNWPAETAAQPHRRSIPMSS